MSTSPDPVADTLILGLGNDLLSDEGVGVHAVRHIESQQAAPPNVLVLDGGTLSFTLAGPIAEARNLIVIDAAQVGGAPGSVRLFRDGEMDDFLNAAGRRSVHEVGLIDLMAISRLTDSLPQRRALIGVQPGRVDWGERPTAAVEQAIPEVCRLALELAREWAA